MSDGAIHSRRRFLRNAAMTLGAIGSTSAQVAPGTNTSFGAIKQVEAGLLNVGYAEAGPANGPAVVLLHGWPYDIHSYVDVAPILASAGYRVIVPYLRGYGSTSFLSNQTFRNGQQAAVAQAIASDFDGPAADGAAYAKKFSGKYSHRILKGIGHNVPQEAPQAFAQAVIDVDTY
jgi:pimeloyl-ACP methyl ester carboxylesterase